MLEYADYGFYNGGNYIYPRKIPDIRSPESVRQIPELIRRLK
jgi:hypothetical protein